MALAAFDTHKFVRKLRGAGFNEEQAEVLTDAVRESQASVDIATKADLREYESAIRGDLEKLEMRLDAKHDSLRKDLFHEMREMESRLTIRLGRNIFSGVAFISALLVIFKFFWN